MAGEHRRSLCVTYENLQNNTHSCIFVSFICKTTYTLATMCHLFAKQCTHLHLYVTIFKTTYTLASMCHLFAKQHKLFHLRVTYLQNNIHSCIYVPLISKTTYTLATMCHLFAKQHTLLLHLFVTSLHNNI